MAAPLRVLYVDDEPALLSIGKIFLEKEGDFAVDTLTSAGEALEQLKNGRYDAIVSDYQMPRIDGITFLKKLKASGNTTPFIIFTGRGREEVVIEAFNNGADFYLQKGGDPKAQFIELAHKIQSSVNRQRTEKLARDTEKRLYDIINFLPDATFAIDTEGKVIAWNRAIEEMTGVPAREMLGKGDYEYSVPFYGERRPILIDLVAILDEGMTRGKYAVIKKEGGILLAETTLPRPLGKHSVLLGKASLLYNDEGKAIGAIESIRDITEQKHAEEELRKKNEELNDSYQQIAASEKALRANLDELTRQEQTIRERETQLDAMATNIPGVVYRFYVNPDGTTGFDYISERSQEVLGIENDPVTFFEKVTEGIVPEDREWFFSSVQNAISTKTLWEFDGGYVRPSGKKIWISAVSSPVIEDDRLIFDGVIFDNTARKQAEGALRESEEKYRTLVEKANEAIIIAQDGFFVFANRRMADLLGVPARDLEGRPFIDFIWPGDREMVFANYSRRVSGGTISDAYDFRIIGAGGELKWVFLSATAIQWKGRPATLNLVTDITERKVAEDALRESEEKLRLKLDSVLSPDVDIDDQDLANIIDIESVQSLMDDFNAATGIPIGIIDLKGNILVKVGWQDICTLFHRAHPETKKNCIESNLALSSGVMKGEFRAYRCKNNMWDIVTPIFIGDKHIGNLFFGQFFYEDEAPDLSVFITQADTYGFDKNQYLAALNRVPRWSREKVKHIMKFYAKFADQVSKLSYSNLKLAKTLSTQKLVEASLQDREEQSRLLLSQLPDIVMVHQDGILVYANQTAVDKTGFSREDLLGSHLFDYVVPEYQEIITRNMARRAAGDQVGDYMVDMVNKSGALRHVIVRTSPIVFNHVPSVVMILDDITESQKAEVALRESESLYRTIFETTGAATIIIDNVTTITMANAGFAALSGFSIDELEGKKSWTEFVVPEDLEQMKQYHYDRRNDPSGEARVYEFRFINRYGEIRHCINNVSVIPGTTRSVASVVDITERKLSEEALRESEKKFRDMFESSVMGLYKTAPNGRLIKANDTFARMYGYSSADEILTARVNVVHFYANPEDRNEVVHFLTEMGVVKNYECPHLKRDGTVFWVSIMARAVRDDDGTVLFY
ncbi:MAG: PAS domain S-box protein, partial [Methanomicrobiales archaeon]